MYMKKNLPTLGAFLRRRRRLGVLVTAGRKKNESDLVIGRTGCGGRCDWYKIIYNQEEAGVS